MTRITLMVLSLGLALSTATSAQDKAPLFTATPTVLVRSPDPAKLSEFYVALGFQKHRVSAKGGVIFHLDGQVGSLEVVLMDAGTKPGPAKTSRTQQGVVAIFETTDQAALVARAKAAGATLVEKWDAADRPVSIYYIGDPENNIIGFAPRHHNASIKTP
jgi:catechol 2,3-dioxygenase-like lactoylglutathione lyase family enzyme